MFNNEYHNHTKNKFIMKNFLLLILSSLALVSCGGGGNGDKISQISSDDFLSKIEDKNLKKDEIKFLTDERLRIVEKISELDRSPEDFIENSLKKYEDLNSLQNICFLTDFAIERVGNNDIKIVFNFDFDNKFDRNRKASSLQVAYGYRSEQGREEFASKLKINEAGTKNFRSPINMSITHNNTDHVSRFISILYKKFTNPETSDDDVKKELQRGFWIKPIEIKFIDGTSVTSTDESSYN